MRLKLKVFINSNNKQLLIHLPRKKLDEDNLPKYVMVIIDDTHKRKKQLSKSTIYLQRKKRLTNKK